MTSKEVTNWADDYMFRSESHDASTGPKVHLLGGPNDPLGQIAACAKMYKGEVVRDLADVTDEERRYYAEQMQLTKLKMPLEAVSLHFMVENVTRAFTHQMVRQRTAAYAQESMRFAVVEDMNEAVALPPSLAWVNEQVAGRSLGEALLDAHGHVDPYSSEFDLLPERVKQFLRWRHAVSTTSLAYNYLVSAGMPAEDARGLMPTNIVTRINYITNFRAMLDHSGNRLCTQAQFEWRLVFAQFAQAMRQYGAEQTYLVNEGGDRGSVRLDSLWQYEVLASLLKPVCYQTGSCAFGADFDRKCSIRERVTANADINRPSSEWGGTFAGTGPNGQQLIPIQPIHPSEWLADPAAAR